MKKIICIICLLTGVVFIGGYINDSDASSRRAKKYSNPHSTGANMKPGHGPTPCKSKYLYQIKVYYKDESGTYHQECDAGRVAGRTWMSVSGNRGISLQCIRSQSAHHSSEQHMVKLWRGGTLLKTWRDVYGMPLTLTIDGNCSDLSFTKDYKQ